MSGWADERLQEMRLDAARRFQRLLAKRMPSGSTFNKRKMQRFAGQVEAAVVDLLTANELLGEPAGERWDLYAGVRQKCLEQPREGVFELARHVAWKVLRDPSGPPVTLAP